MVNFKPEAMYFFMKYERSPDADMNEETGPSALPEGTVHY